MPLSSFQSAILSVLAVHRRPESHVAGAAVLNRSGPRYSRDIDIFHDREEQVAASAENDAKTLEEAGFTVHWVRREPGMYAAEVMRGSDSMRLEWVRDSDFRFFSTMPDPLFGETLHPFDIATNKVLAAAGRREPRDILDLLHVHDRHLPLGAVVWAAVAKDPGYSPESLIAEIRRNARYRTDDYADLDLEKPVDAAEISRRLREVLAQAEQFVRAMPPGKEGLVFLEDGKPVQPDPERLDKYTELSGTRGGHFPSSPEIGSAMLARQLKEPNE